MNLIIKCAMGWYDFSKLDQSNNYIKVHNLNCGDNKTAIKQAKNILHNKKAKITIKEAA
jgi:1,2-phenylacetyl-CoA epoxidase PaaB subunit